MESPKRFDAGPANPLIDDELPPPSLDSASERWWNIATAVITALALALIVLVALS